MKYNLKNRPDLDEIAKKNPNKSLTWLVADYHGKATKWFEGFEKQFEEWETTLRQWQLSGEKKGSRTRPSMLYVIQEVLGVEGKEKAKP
jgi:hypothetical protein